MKLKQLDEIIRRDYVQTAIMILLVIVSFVAFWYGMRLAFMTENPLWAVASGSMETTLYKGDLILVQGVQNACNIHAAPQDALEPGDIIVFRSPVSITELIVHRAIAKYVRNGHCYFRTQGDNKRTNPYPDSWEVKESDIVGKFTGAKMPLIGYIALFIEPLHVKLTLVFLWIVLLILLEFIPFGKKGRKVNP